MTASLDAAARLGRRSLLWLCSGMMPAPPRLHGCTPSSSRWTRLRADSRCDWATNMASWALPRDGSGGVVGEAPPVGDGGGGHSPTGSAAGASWGGHSGVSLIGAAVKMRSTDLHLMRRATYVRTETPGAIGKRNRTLAMRHLANASSCGDPACVIVVVAGRSSYVVVIVVIVIVVAVVRHRRHRHRRPRLHLHPSLSHPPPIRPPSQSPPRRSIWTPSSPSTRCAAERGS